ncbi:MAG: DUF1549 domain-containing protein, partial [Planctomycetaceae bacterium]|nr:DUF1549 domain-containing protein [Planctomycetaceae bacterium]
MKTCISAVLIAALLSVNAPADDVIVPTRDRFAATTDETPDFQRHVVPLLGKLGCNGRACHGSFQGRGGFQLSLFGYDFEMDHQGLSERIDTDDPAASYALHKPTLQDPHEGGKRLEVGSWEYNLLLSWIEGGAKPRAEDAASLTRLEIMPPEVRFASNDGRQQLQAVAVWSDGAREDVTCLCRFQTNDEAIAGIDNGGLVTAGTTGDTHVVVSYDAAVVAVPVLRPVSELVDDRFPEVPTPTVIDELVVQKLRKLGVVPSDVCTDEEFLRRVSLDLAGTLPTSDEVRQFLADESADKRAKKIDDLLKTPAYAAWWTTKRCDWTGNSPAQLNQASAAARGTVPRQWYDWINQRVEQNVPYDQLVEGIVLAQGRQADEDYRAYCERMSAMNRGDGDQSFADTDGLIYFWGRRNFMTSEERAIGFAYTFMGTRIQCAQCHKHPFDVWTQSDFEQFELFFERVRYARGGGNPREAQALIAELGLKDKKGGELQRGIAQAAREGKTVPFPDVQIVRGVNRRGPKKKNDDDEAPANVAVARLLGGETVDLAEVRDPRTALMNWLRTDEKQLFAKAFVNRVWANYFHRGIVEPTDDLSLANPPSNAPLLEHLAKGFVAHNFDMHWVHREICNSATYQRSWKPTETNVHDERNFSRAVPRRLPSEVAYDALVLATAGHEQAEEFATQLDGRMLVYNSGPRANRGGRGPDYALAVFGRSTRENNCDCDRSADASLLQTVFLRNDNEALQMIDREGGWINDVVRELSTPPSESAASSGPDPGGRPRRFA